MPDDARANPPEPGNGDGAPPPTPPPPAPAVVTPGTPPSPRGVFDSRSATGASGLRSHSPRHSPEHRRRRFQRHRRRAYIRSVYSLPSLATLGNAICGFAAIYIAGLPHIADATHLDRITRWFAHPDHRFVWAAYFIFIAMLFDALDGRLARFARHTTDFGGQLDSLADVISFGAAPAFIALQLFKAFPEFFESAPLFITRLNWAIGALYMSCAAIRLARFNVSNKHGEQHHFSFLGLPSPGAAGAVAAMILLHEELRGDGFTTGTGLVHWTMPLVVLISGLLMVSTIRYPHLVNRYLRGKKSIPMLLGMLAIVLLLVVSFTYTLAAGLIVYTFWGLTTWLWGQVRRRSATPPAPAAPPTP